MARLTEVAPWTPPTGSASARALEHATARSGEGAALDSWARVAIHFHPDRLHLGVPLLAQLAADGVLRSQFETATSNGGLTAHAGGDRWRWESRIFGGAYDDAAPAERPKYGALELQRRRSAGPSPRFGSAHVRLRAQVLARCTFCYPDSFYEPKHFGVATRMAVPGRLESHPQEDPLDRYVEAQIHGPTRLAEDVEALVLDPSFRGTEVEALAARLPCAIEWHRGFRLRLDELRRHPEYRGPAVLELGERLAEGGLLTPRMIGDAARDERFPLQDLKKVWHCLARFGEPT